MRSLFCFSLLPFMPVLVGQTIPPAFHGTVLSQNGVPVVGASIIYHRLPASGLAASGRGQVLTVEPEVWGQVTSASGGVFSASSLPAGRYEICAEADGYVGTCRWLSPTKRSIAAGETVDIGTIQVLPEASIRIRVQDPKGILPPDDPTMPPIIVGVSTDRLFVRALQVSSNATSRDFAIVVPYDVPAQLVIQSLRFATSFNGVALPANQSSRVPLIAQTGNNQQNFTITVTGLRP